MADTESDRRAENDRQPCPPEWQAWDAGTGLCPYCDGMPFEDWMAMCDCFMSVEQWENITGLKANEQPHSEDGTAGSLSDPQSIRESAHIDGTEGA